MEACHCSDEGCHLVLFIRQLQGDSLKTELEGQEFKERLHFFITPVLFIYLFILQKRGNKLLCVSRLAFHRKPKKFTKKSFFL